MLSEKKQMMTFRNLSFAPHQVDPNGVHARMNFENGYGVSVIQTRFSYGGDEGLYEMAVLKGKDICDDTPVANDVLGYLTKEDVTEKMMLVQELPSCLPAEENSGFFAMATESSDRALQMLAEMEIDNVKGD